MISRRPRLQLCRSKSRTFFDPDVCFRGSRSLLLETPITMPILRSQEINVAAGESADRAASAGGKPAGPSSYRWVIVAAGGLMGCVAIGAMFSLAVFLGPMSTATGWSRAAISSAMTLDFIVMGIAGFAWGAISDRFGVRVVVLSGAVLLGAGLVIASRATSLLTF